MINGFLVLHNLWVKFLDYFKDIFLLVIRLYWGYSFFDAGLSKFSNWERSLGYFTKLNIPFTEINLLLASFTELVGGLFLIFGFASRYITLPLIFTMVVAYLTAHIEDLKKIFVEPYAFISASPFNYLFVCLVVLLFGAGRISIDHFLNKNK